MELAAITGTIVSTVTTVADPDDIDSKGNFARFIVGFDCGHSHTGQCKVAVYFPLTPAVPNFPLAPRDEVALTGPLFSTAWGGTAIEAETMAQVATKASV